MPDTVPDTSTLKKSSDMSIFKIVTAFGIFRQKRLVNFPIRNIFEYIFDYKVGNSVKQKSDVPELSRNTNIQL